jgi:hypothetical protein
MICKLLEIVLFFPVSSKSILILLSYGVMNHPIWLLIVLKIQQKLLLKIEIIVALACTCFFDSKLWMWGFFFELCPIKNGIHIIYYNLENFTWLYAFFFLTITWLYVKICVRVLFFYCKEDLSLKQGQLQDDQSRVIHSFFFFFFLHRVIHSFYIRKYHTTQVSRTKIIKTTVSHRKLNIDKSIWTLIECMIQMVQNNLPIKLQ